MKKLVSAAAAVPLLVPAAAAAKPVTAQHRRQYLADYHNVRHLFGAQEAGCNLLERKGSCHARATDEAVVRSLGVLSADLAPPSTPAPTVVASPTTTTDPTSVGSSGAASSSGHMACIIQHESGGDPNATNGQYGGIGQWSPEAWAQDGGTQYAASPTAASYAQQAQVLASEGDAQMTAQQGNFDGCG